MLDLLRGGRFVDKAPAQVWATLLDEGVYLCSQSTMYRLLRAHGEVRERRRHARHPARVKPELVAYRPNEVWSWDITKLPGPARGVHYDLYVIIDIYSRYVVGWQVAVTETGELAEELIADSIARIGSTPHTVHADRGSSMTSKPVSVLLADLGITRSHSRPRVSDDNPFSEAQFRTLKYCPAFPERFGCWPMPERSANSSSPTTTTSTATAASACTPRPRSTSEPLTRSGRTVPAPSPTPTPRTPTDSASHHDHPRCPAQRGSTSQPYRPFKNTWSQRS